MKAVALFRHGQIVREWQERFYGRLDVPLSEEGQRESLRAVSTLAELKALTRVYSSPLERALFPARLLAQMRQVVLKVDPLLQEIDYGTWAGRTRGEVLAEPLYWARFQDENLPVPNGESIRDLRNRAKCFWDSLQKEHQQGIAVVFTHGGFLRALVAELLNLSSEFFFSIEILHLRGVLILIFKDGNFVLRGLNILPTQVALLTEESYW